MSENNTANQEVEQVEQPVETSKEEKFFGVKHQIGKSKDDSTEKRLKQQTKLNNSLFQRVTKF